MIARARAFMLGFYRFRRFRVRRYTDPVLTVAYDDGRELAHRLTLNLFRY